MAKMKLSMAFSDMRGKLNGSKFSKGRSSHTVTNKIKGNNPRTSAQGEIRTYFRQLTAQWKTLTDAQILAFNAAALETNKKNVFGDAYKTTGHKLFVKQNVNALKNGGIVSLVPLTPAIPTVVDVETLVLTASGQVMTFVTTEALDLNTKLLVTATPPVSNGKTNLNGLFRKVALLDYPLVAGVNNISSAYVARFGAFPAGKKIGFRVYTVAVAGIAQYKANHDLSGKVQ